MSGLHNESNLINKTAAELHFKYLPQFAAWIRDNKLEDFSRLMLQVSKAENVPILKLFVQYSDEDLIEMGKVSGAELLTRLAENKAQEHIEITIGEWIANRLPTIDRDEIVAEDIARISFVRRQVCRILLDDYAKDGREFRNVMEEVDKFTMATDIAGFNAYIQIHQQKIQAMNEQLNAQRTELLEAQELAQMGSFFWDLEGKGRSVYTPMVLEIFELEETNSLESFLQDVHPDDREKVKDALTNAFQNHGIYECEYRYIRNNKTKRISSRGIVQYENGKPIGMKGTVMDVTAQSELLQKLKESEALHKQAQALTHIGNWSWNILTNEISWSDEMYRIYGLAPQSEIITFERFMSLVHPDNREPRMQEIQRSLETGIAEDYILKIVTPAGEEKILKGKGEIMTDRTGRPVSLEGTCQDISIEYRLNQNLADKERYLSLLINNAPDAIIVIDEKSVIQLWNPKTESVFGWKADEVLGRDLAETIIPARYRDAHNHGMKRYLATGQGNVMNRSTEVTAMNNRNEELFISLTISEIIQDGNRSFIAFLRDITQQKHTWMELQHKTQLLEQKNQQLKHTNEELESFNYAASHDLQEPLRKIQIFADRLQTDEHALTPKMKGYVEKIMSSSTRMQALIKDLLSFTQATTPDELIEEVDLMHLIHEVRNTLMHRIEETGARISYTKLPVIKVVSFQFMQVFTNLISNAIKYRKQGVAPDIWIGYSIVKKEDLGNESAFINGNYLKISIADNGTGFDPQFAERIFDLFARLHDKKSYHGTGIGLAICKKIIQNHQGFIRAESDGETGSTFHIYLPDTRVVHL
jgi:PAS domain S-box-containing protein